MIDSLPPLREVITQYGLAARKSLGQHFLLDLNLTDRIARQAGDLSTGTVIEVGPGPGGLTRALLANGARQVIAIERDDRCLEALAPLAEAADGRLEIVAEDALKVAANELGEPPRRIVANLPYNISTVLLVNWLRHAAAFDRMVLMFQKEVADRLIAAPGDSAYGRLSVMTRWRTEARLAFHVDRRAFTPPPKVTSSVVVLTPRPEAPDDPPFTVMERVVGAAFGQRRKMLRVALKTLTKTPIPLLEAAGIDPKARAETLDVADFIRLARQWMALREG